MAIVNELICLTWTSRANSYKLQESDDWVVLECVDVYDDASIKQVIDFPVSEIEDLIQGLSKYVEKHKLNSYIKTKDIPTKERE